jgi:hypothetical protein
MAPFGPLYFLKKHHRQPASASVRDARQEIGAFFDRSKAQRSEP